MRKTVLAVGGLLVMSAAAAQASSVGLSSDPAGAAWNRGDAGSAHAIWETFPSLSYSGDAADTMAGFGSVTAGQAVSTNAGQGEGTYNIPNPTPSVTPVAEPGDYLYSGSSARSFTITGSVDADAFGGVYLQVKRANGTTWGTATAPALNGIASTSLTTMTEDDLIVGDEDPSSPSGNWLVQTWYWSAATLAGESTSNFTLTFGTPSHRPIDAIVLDVQAVPEPATIGALGLVAAVAGLRRRRLASI